MPPSLPYHLPRYRACHAIHPATPPISHRVRHFFSFVFRWWFFFFFLCGCRGFRAVQSTQPPAQPAQIARTRPTSTRSDCFGGQTQVPSSKTRCWWVGFKSPPLKLVKPDLPEKHEHSGEFSSFSTRFQLDFVDFVNQNNQIWHKYTRSSDS